MVRRTRFRKMYRPPREKNYFISNSSGVATGTSTRITFAVADNGSADNSIHFPGKIKAVYVTGACATGTLVAGATMAAILVKDVGGAQFAALNPNGTLSNLTQQQTIFYTRMSLHSSSNPLKFVGWIKIPRRHQIFNEGDELVWVYQCTNVGSDYEHCTTFIYLHE